MSILVKIAINLLIKYILTKLDKNANIKAKVQQFILSMERLHEKAKQTISENKEITEDIEEIVNHIKNNTIGSYKRSIVKNMVLTEFGIDNKYVNSLIELLLIK